MRSSLAALVAVFAMSGAAYAEGGPVVQGLGSMRGQAEHMSNVLRNRNMPHSVVRTPEKAVHKGTQEMRARLLEGTTAEPTLAEANGTTDLKAVGNKTSKIDAVVRLSGAQGTAEHPVARQFVQATSETAVISRDPRIGVQADRAQVVQFKTKGTPQPGRPDSIIGKSVSRTITPLSPGLTFREGKLEAGSSLVVSNHGGNMQFAPDGSLQAHQPLKTETYLLKADAEGKLKAVSLTPQEITDLKANSPFTSKRLNKEGTELEPNHAKGYSPEALKEQGF
jgi:hypothetical protein